jgi:hypothetical protein
VSNKLKAIVAALASVLAIVNTVLAHYQPPAGTDPAALDWRTIAAQVAVPILVYFVPNLPKGLLEAISSVQSKPPATEIPGNVKVTRTS